MTQSTHMVTFSFLILCTLKLNGYYCVKCHIFAIFDVSTCISQGSLATYLKCNEEIQHDLAENLLPSPIVTEF